MTYPEGWHQASEERSEQLIEKLSQAIGEQNVLYGKPIRVIAYRHQSCMDELLCQHLEEKNLFTLLHLVWSLTSSATHRAAPIVEVHGCFQDFLNYERDVQRRVIPEVGDSLCFQSQSKLDRLFKEAEQKAEELGRQRGMLIGENKGLAVGEIQGQVKVLARQLCRRFRLTPTDAIARLNGASSEQYEQWADNILTAQTLEQVFQSVGEHHR